MTSKELLSLIEGGETSTLQLKQNVTNTVTVAQEMIAFANSYGGKIIIGVSDKTGDVVGLSYKDIQRIGNLLATSAQDHVKPPIVITTSTVAIQKKHVIVAEIPNGISKPYRDKDGIVFIKNGPDKRKVTSNEEISRLLQSAGTVYAEEIILHHSSLEDLDLVSFRKYYEEKFKEVFNTDEVIRYLSNLRLGSDGKLNVAGALLFAKNSQRLLPAFFITAIWFPGNNIADVNYLSSSNIVGTIGELFNKSLDFIIAKLHTLQNDKSFNSVGDLEIPEVVFQELIANAIVHRDYFINDSIKVFVFSDRIEIKSPGKLTNNLTIEHIKHGVRRSRNTILASFASDFIQYRGAGSGIIRALQAYPNIEFVNDTSAEEFIVTIHRPGLISSVGTKSGPSRDQVETEVTQKGLSKSASNNKKTPKGTKSGLSRDQVGTKYDEVWDQVAELVQLPKKDIKLIFELCATAQPITFLMGKLGYANRTKFREKFINPLIEKGFIELTIPSAPKSSKQKYITTPKVHQLFFKV